MKNSRLLTFEMCNPLSIKLFVEFPVPFRPVWSLTRPLPVPCPSGLPRSHKGMGTDTIFDFRPPTTKLFRSLYSPLGIPYLTPPLPVLYPSLTYPLLIPYASL